MEAWAKGELAKYLIPRLNTSVQKLLPKVKELVGAGMLASRHYTSLISGTLKYEFGLAEPTLMVGTIVAAVQASVMVKTLPASSTSFGGIEIGAFYETFADAMSASGSVYQSHSKRSPGGVDVPWLKWLLFSGDSIVLKDVQILRGDEPGANNYPKRKIFNFGSSRTGPAIMVRRNYSTGSVQSRYHKAVGHAASPGWRVPPEFAGSASRNWIIEVADAIAPQVEVLLEQEARNL